MLSLFRDRAVQSRPTRLEGEVLLVQPLNYTILTVFFATALVAAFCFAFTGSYPRTERVTGFVKPSLGIVEVAGSSAGTVGSIDVRAGDRVEAGQVLATLITESHAPGGVSAAGNAVTELGRQLVELESMIEVLPVEIQRRRERLGFELGELDVQLDQLAAQWELQTEIVASSKKVFDLADRSDRSALSRSEFERLRRESLLAQRDLAQMEERIATIRARRAVVLADRDDLQFELTRRKGELESQASELRRRRVEWAASREQVLVAPIPGTVADARRGVGAHVGAGEALFTILPEGGRLHAEVYVDSRAIGFVSPGKEVQLNYDAFPKEHFGIQLGWVGDVGGVILAADDIDTPSTLAGPAYRVIVELETESVSAGGVAHRLRPGMLLEADLVLEERSLLHWVLGPLLQRKGGDRAI